MALSTSTADRENKRAQERAARRANIANQTRRRSNLRSDGGIHTIDNETKPARKQEASDVATVDKPPTRRWQRASHLPTMPDIPGYSLKYVRIDGKERGDHRGVFKHIQEQWEFARASDFPSKEALPTYTLGRYGDVIGNGDMVLMKIHDDLRDQRNAHFAEKRDRATEGIDAQLFQASDERMPIRQKRKTHVKVRKLDQTRRGSSSPKVADDDDPDNL